MMDVRKIRSVECVGLHASCACFALFPGERTRRGGSILLAGMTSGDQVDRAFAEVTG